MVEVLNCNKIKNGYEIELKENVFYPDGKGGQLGDRGYIGESKILEVKESKVIVDRELSLGEYKYSIDENRRRDIAQQHTAQHLFSAIAYNDYQLNTVGFRMAEEYTTVDLDSNTISDETIEALEFKANEIIEKAIQLKIYIMNHEDAMKVEGLRKAIKDKVTGDVRFVEIPEVDLGACAGFHVENTKDIRVFKLINHEKIKGNYTRFYFIAGDRALNDYSFKHRLSRDLCHIFSCKNEEIVEMVDKFLDEKKKVEGELKNLAANYSELLSEKLMREAKTIGENKVIIYLGDKVVGQFLGRYIDLDNYLLITGSDENYSLMSNKVNCKEFIKHIITTQGGIKGGGSETKGNFKGKISKDELLNNLKTFLS